jgi:16S rRNA (cytidine1402-2'-O)-methyltransferase
MSKLYLISTPIGNRQDISFRAVQTLFSVDILLCEDTRNSHRLLNFYQEKLKDWQSDWLKIDFSKMPQLISYFEHNEEKRIPEILAFLKQGKKVGLISNAGTPGISDPGFKLVKNCLENNVLVVSIPGPSALISALSISGLSSDKFTFLGFLPRKQGKQIKIWQDLQKSQLDQTIIFYESSFRILKTLQNIEKVFGDIKVCIARELTKVYEETKFEKISKWKQVLQKNLKGELVILIRLGEQKP